MIQIPYLPSSLAPIFSVVPMVFVFLWTLIVGDIKNFTDSQRSYLVYTAKDPVNCYQNFVQPNGKQKSN